jgi:hypothetical protein
MIPVREHEESHMIRTFLRLAVLTLGALACTDAALATSLRCGSHLLEAGARHSPGMYEVLMKCGPPTVRHGNTWIYERSGTRRIVHFNDAGQLVRVEGSSGR